MTLKKTLKNALTTLVMTNACGLSKDSDASRRATSAWSNKVSRKSKLFSWLTRTFNINSMFCITNQKKWIKNCSFDWVFINWNFKLFFVIILMFSTLNHNHTYYIFAVISSLKPAIEIYRRVFHTHVHTHSHTHIF